MNSDFVQQHAERFARRVATEPDTRARIVAAYRILFGRPPTDAEIAAGQAYVTSEPMKAYEERKAAPPKPADPAPSMQKPAETVQAEGGMPSDGMMGGVARPSKPEDQKKLLPVTAWGRYMKVLMTSNEFVFVN